MGDVTTVDAEPGAETQPEPPESRQHSSPIPRILLIAAAAGLLTLVAALTFGHGVEHKPAGGLPWAGSGTAWALPVARFVHDAAAIITLGFLILAIALLPDRKGLLGPSARVAMRIARLTAGIWVLAVVVEALFSLSEEAAVPLSQLNGSNIRFYVFHVTEGKTFLAVAIAALLIVLKIGRASCRERV